MLIGSSIHNRCLALLMLAFVPNDENSLTSVSESDNQLSLFFLKSNIFDLTQQDCSVFMTEIKRKKRIYVSATIFSLF